MSDNAKNLPINQVISGAVCKFCDNMLTNMNCENIMFNILPLKDVTETLSRTSERVDTRFESSDRGQELLNKASYYKIPIDKDNLNWLELIDDVGHYELLLEEADNLHIEWDISEYDPVGLQQEIEYRARQEREDQRDLYRSYYNPCVLGV